MKKVRVYHNPRCSKSREAVQLLRDRGVEPELLEYLKTPPSAAELDVLIDRLGVEPAALLRTKEPAYAEAGLSKASTRADIVRALAEHPSLLERPIAVVDDDGKGVIGRPPERVLELLD